MGDYMINNITADDVASYLILFSNSVGDYISNLKLQKLLYYAQAWHLAIKKQILFDEEFQAWIHGPVIRRLYGNYKKYGCNPILVDNDTNFDKKLHDYEKGFGTETSEFLKDIIDEYFKFSAYELERMVHKEDPWNKARLGLPDDEPSENIIKREWMKEYYSQFIVNR